MARRPLRSLFALAQGVSTDTMLAQSRSMLFSLSRPLILGLLLGMSCAPDCEGYSVLSHEAIVDAAWKDGIVPLLLSRFPDATPEKEPPECFGVIAPYRSQQFVTRHKASGSLNEIQKKPKFHVGKRHRVAVSFHLGVPEIGTERAKFVLFLTQDTSQFIEHHSSMWREVT